MGDDLHLVSRVGQELIVFWTSLAGPGFESSGAVGYGIGGDLGEELINERGLFAGLVAHLDRAA